MVGSHVGNISPEVVFEVGAAVGDNIDPAVAFVAKGDSVTDPPEDETMLGDGE